MVANWRLGYGALFFMMMGTQPAHSLDWELIQDVRDDASPQVPVQKVAPMQHSSNRILVDADMNTPGSDQGANIEKGKDGENSTVTEELQLETIIKASHQKQLNDNFRPERAEVSVSGTQQGIEPSHSRKTRTMVDNGFRGITEAQHSLSIKRINQQHQFNEFQTTLNVYRNKSMETGKWELVTEKESDETANIASTINSDISIAWELVPTGDELSVNEIIDEMVEQKTNRLHAEQKINQKIRRITKPNWLTRLFNGIRTQPAKPVPKGEEPIAEGNDAADIALEVRTEVKELKSLLIAHFTSTLVQAAVSRGGQVEVNQDRYTRHITSELAVGISGPDIYDGPVTSRNELIGNIETSLVLEDLDIMEQIGDNKEWRRAVPLIQIRF